MRLKKSRPIPTGYAWGKVKPPAEKGPHPFLKYGYTQQDCLRLANAAIAAKPWWWQGDVKRKKRAGKPELTAEEFHDWLWSFTVSHGKNRLPKDHFLRDYGVTMDPFQVMKSLKKNAALTQAEQKAWDAAMVEMVAYRDASAREVENAEITPLKRDKNHAD
jgi:hypothetical protein